MASQIDQDEEDDEEGFDTIRYRKVARSLFASPTREEVKEALDLTEQAISKAKQTLKDTDRGPARGSKTEIEKVSVEHTAPSPTDFRPKNQDH